MRARYIFCVHGVTSLRLAVVETMKRQTATVAFLNKQENTEEDTWIVKKVTVPLFKTHHIAEVVDKD